MSVCRLVIPSYRLIKREKSISSLNDYRSRLLYKYFIDIQTRWRDNDMYGHVNNVVYGEWIDSIVNHYLICKCSFNPLKSSNIGIVVKSDCSYYSPISYPSTISVGLFISRIGNSSVDYKVGIFENKESSKASAVGGFTHVFVDRINNRPQKISDEIKKEFLSITNLIE